MSGGLYRLMVRAMPLAKPYKKDHTAETFAHRMSSFAVNDLYSKGIYSNNV